MPSPSATLRRATVVAAIAAAMLVVLTAPASAHAELVSSDPANGAHLDAAPARITMRFTESVNLITGGMRLLDSLGSGVKTAEPKVEGPTVTWPLPKDLADGEYTASWRVVSSDGHPIAGAFSFGVGTAPPTAATVPAATTPPAADTAPWPVLAARLSGYLAFSVLAGLVAFVLWCSPGSRGDPLLQLLARGALIGGLLSALASLLVQGPYVEGVTTARVLDPALLRDTLGTPFGAAICARSALYACLLGLLWSLPTLTTRLVRWLAPAAVAASAVAVAAAGHGASSGRPLDLAVVALHVLTAGIWVGGLVVLVSLGRSVEPRAWTQFSSLAMTSVLVLVTTGVLNSVRHLHEVGQIWSTRYGLILVVKLVLVSATLVAAAFSRRHLHHQRTPRGSVRVEALLTVGVLAATAALSMTSPPPSRDDTASRTATAPTGNSLVMMPLGDGRTAGLAVLPASTTGSKLHLLLSDRGGRPLATTRVELTLSNPGRRLAAIPVPLAEQNGVWAADYTFPLPGRWKAVLTVEDRTLSAVVTSGQFTVTGTR
jgi:copper transport protein